MLTLDKVINEMPDVHFYWAGDGQFKTQILKTLEKYNNFHYIGFLGYPDEVRKYLTEIDIYAHPTGMDVMPLSCREAMAMKKPIIATNVEGIPEMIYHKKTGLLVEEGNSQAWIKNIRLLLEDNELSKRLGDEARKLAVEKFNWDILTKKFLEVTKSYLNSPRKSSAGP